MYAMVYTRPDIAHVVGVVSRFMAHHGKEHWEAVMWIFKYLRGTSKLCLSFRKGKPVLEGYTDADMAGTLMVESLHLVICLLLQGEPYHGNPSCKNVLLYPERRLSI